jgi:hypothetical protein
VPIRPYQVYVRRHLALDNNFHRQESGRDLVEVKNLTGVLLHKFKAKIDMMSTEVRRQRAGRMSGAESGADERSGRAERTSGADERSGRAERTSGAERMSGAKASLLLPLPNWRVSFALALR